MQQAWKAALTALLLLNATISTSFAQLGASAYVVTNGHVIATFEGENAIYDSWLYLDQAGVGPIFFNHGTPVGTTYDLGYFTAGTELIFRLYVSPEGYSYYTGPASRNPDGVVHAQVLANWPVAGQTYVGFEDQVAGGDQDYDDHLFSFSNVIPGSPPGFVELVVSNAWILEGNVGNTNLVFPLMLTAASTQTVSLAYSTANGTALAGSDYMATNGIVIFAPGVTNQTITVQVLRDIAVEPDNVFYVQLGGIVNAIVKTNRAVGTIINDDGLPGQLHHFGWSPLNSPQYSGAPFTATIVALDINNNIVAGFSEAVTLSASPAPLSVLPASTPNFASGAWSGDVTVTGNATNAVLTATDAIGHSGSANSIVVWTTNDLVLFASAAPNPVGWTSNLTYSSQVMNPGPLDATGVFLTNALPSGVDIVSMTSSQGDRSTNGNLLICALGTVTNGTTVTATIVVSPMIPAVVLTNVAVVVRNEADANPVNNAVTNVVKVLTGLPVIWTNSSGGDWSVAANWRPQRVPQANDFVIITNNGTYVINIESNITVAALLFGSDSVGSNQILKLAGHTFSVAGHGTNRIGSAFVGPGTLAVENSLRWSGGSNYLVTLTVSSNAVLTLDGYDTKYLTESVLLNAGTVNWSDGTFAGSFCRSNSTVAITNFAGAVFNISSSYSLAATSNGFGNLTFAFDNAGTVNKSNTSSIVFAPWFHNSGAAAVGQGALRFQRGFTSSGTWDLAVTNAVILDNPGGLAPVYNFDPSSQFLGTGNFLYDHASGTYAITINGTIPRLTWGDGYLVNSKLTIPTNGVFTMTANAQKYLWGDTIILNAGTVNCLVGCCVSVCGYAGNTTAITNLPGGLFDIQSDFNINSNTAYAGDTQMFHNAGTLRKRTSTGTALFDIPFINTGTVQVQLGAVKFDKGFTSSGTWELAVTNAVKLDSIGNWTYPEYVFTGGSQFLGNGNFFFDNYDTASGIVINGTIRNFAWRSGTLRLLPLTIPTNGVLTLDSTSTKTMVHSTLINAGTVNWTAGVLQGLAWGNNQTVAITNLPGAVFNLTSSGALDHNPGSSTNLVFRFDNAGTIRKAGTSTPAFEARLRNAGAIELQAGGLSFTSDYLQTDGLTFLNGGTLQSAQPIRILGGVLAGTNTITGSVTNGATVSPGNPIGTLRITGTYTELPSGALNIDLAGTTAGATFDVLTNGVARLAGTLNVSLTNGFNPAISNQFQFMRATSVTGAFSQTNAPGFALNYTNTPVGLKLTFLGLPPAVTTLPATSVSSTGAVLNASVTPFTYATPTWFEWGTNTDYGMTTPTNALATGSAIVPVNVTLSNLVAQTTYHYRAVASNGFGGGLILGNDVSFVARDPRPPFATTQPVTPGGGASIILQGMATPNGLPTMAWFEWGASSSFGNQTPPVSVGSGENIVAVTNRVTDPAPGQSFHYRLVATNSAGVAYGAESLFGLGKRAYVWGLNYYGQTNKPAGLNNVVAIAAGGDHNLAVQNDGTVVAWGDNTDGQTNTPAGLSNVVAVASGLFHSLAVKGDGTVVAWGRNNNGQTNTPAELSNVLAVAGCEVQSLALEGNGSVRAWGDTSILTNVPSQASNVVAVAASGVRNFALKNDGSVIGWGYVTPGQPMVPPGLSNVVAIAAGRSHAVALVADGSVVAWGDNAYDQTNTPSGLSNVIAIAAGGWHSLALKKDGTVVAWGFHDNGETNILVGLNNVVAIAAGNHHNLALADNSPPVATPLTVSALHDQDLIISFACADPNGDLLSCKIVTVPLAGKLYQCDGGSRGVQISTNGTWATDPDDRVIFVLGTNSFGTNCDSFQFVANDGMADSSPATVTINASASSPWNCGWHNIACGANQISMCLTSSVPGYNYVVQCSSNLVNWVPYQTNVTPFTLVVTNTRPVQFFRALYAP